MTEGSGGLPDDYPFRMDLASIAGHATAEYGLSHEEIADTFREMAEWAEDDENLKRLYYGANETAKTEE